MSRHLPGGPSFRLTVALTIMCAFTQFGWWGFNLWLPGYLSLPVSDGGIGLLDDDHVCIRLRHADRHVVRLRVVRLHQRTRSAAN